MKKGQNKRVWTPEQKAEIVHKHLDGHVSVRRLKKEYDADRGMICKWEKSALLKVRVFYSKEASWESFFSATYQQKTFRSRTATINGCEVQNRKRKIKKRILGERSWCSKGIRYWQRQEFEVIDELRSQYTVRNLCRIMSVNRFGYYKWRKRKGQLNRYEKDRVLLTKLLEEEHKKYPSHGYHRLAEDVFAETGWVFSHNLAHKCCKTAGIHSKARKYRYKKPGEENVKFSNKVNGNWNAASPLEIVVSDMTMFKHKGIAWEWTLLVDTFNNEILAHQATCIPGSNKPYYHCLEHLKQLVKKKRGADTPGSLPHRPGFCLLLTGFLPGP